MADTSEQAAPAQIIIRSDGPWYNTRIELRDADGYVMPLRVSAFVMEAEIGQPMQVHLTLCDGAKIELECPVVERSRDGALVSTQHTESANEPGFVHHPVTDMSHAHDAPGEDG
jgi:hypothetical protein